ncbi:MAG: DUF2953 domain-containing protein [Clostridium sp.]|uniref:DUF2953 domain-containing protein n=1 Tax=Clostridium sp. TaxID=1506 RepID=UPI002FC729F2
MICLILLILYLLLVKISLNFKYENLYITLSINIFPFKITIINNKKLPLKKESKEKPNFNSKFNIYLRKNRKYIITKSLKRIHTKIHSKLLAKLSINIEYGFERKDITALLYGGLLSMLPIIKIELFNFKRFNFTYNVYPDFSRSYFNMKVNYVLNGRGFQLISIIFILLKEILIIRKNTKVKE